MDEAIAKAEILNVFATYKARTAADAATVAALIKGKLYELYVLAQLVQDLTKRGFHLTFKGTSLQFKGAPGKIKLTDPHFEVRSPNSAKSDLWIFVDIEFETLGHFHAGVPMDDSCRHELDIVVVDSTPDYPAFANIQLGVECKAVASVQKHLVKEALGVRRELSMIHAEQDSLLTQLGSKVRVKVKANPPSEFWFAHIDPTASRYANSPSAFGIDFKFICP